MSQEGVGCGRGGSKLPWIDFDSVRGDPLDGEWLGGLGSLPVLLVLRSGHVPWAVSGDILSFSTRPMEARWVL